MAQEVKLPELGESVTSGIIIEWLVAVGDRVEVDQPLFELSTDKIDTEVPSPFAGTVQQILAEVDDEIEVGTVVCIIGEGDAPASDDGGSDAASEDTASEDIASEDIAESAEASEPEAEADAEPGADAEAEKPDASKAEKPEPDAEAEKAAPAAKAAPAKAAPKAEAGDDHFDVIILGAGTGGYSCALRAAQLGLSVALVEKEKVGGTCLHWGCIPTKAFLQSAEVAEHAQDAHEFGIKLSYEGIEVAAVNAHKDAVVDKMWKGLQGALKGRGVETVAGTGIVTAANQITVALAEGGARTITGNALVLATGSKPRELPFAPFDGKRVISSDHALFLDKLPKKAIILGSGAVGMEFATAWHAFGVEVTVVELLDRLLPLEDVDASKEIQRAWRKKGINVLTSTKLTEVSTTTRSVTCTVENPKGEVEELKADLLLVAVGRAPVTTEAGLENIGVETDRGFVVVDEYCRTNVEGVYALGDIIPTLGLAHASFAEGFLVADQLAGLEVTPIDYKGVPRVTFSHPEVASVGYAEAEAKEAGFEVVVEKYPFQALGRAAMMKASGMVKVIAEKDDSAEGGAGRVLGIHIVGPRATDLISEAQMIYNWEALPSDVAHFIHAHPTLGEAMGEAHLALAGRALHG